MSQITTYTVQHGATGETLASGLSYLDAVNVATNSSLIDEAEARALMARIARNDGESRYHTVVAE